MLYYVWLLTFLYYFVENTNLQDKLKEITEKLGEAEEISKNLLLEKQKAALEEEKLEAQLREGKNYDIGYTV